MNTGEKTPGQKNKNKAGGKLSPTSRNKSGTRLRNMQSAKRKVARTTLLHHRTAKGEWGVSICGVEGQTNRRFRQFRQHTTHRIIQGGTASSKQQYDQRHSIPIPIYFVCLSAQHPSRRKATVPNHISHIMLIYCPRKPEFVRTPLICSRHQRTAEGTVGMRRKMGLGYSPARRTSRRWSS